MAYKPATRPLRLSHNQVTTPQPVVTFCQQEGQRRHIAPLTKVAKAGSSQREDYEPLWFLAWWPHPQPLALPRPIGHDIRILMQQIHTISTQPPKTLGAQNGEELQSLPYAAGVP